MPRRLTPDEHAVWKRVASTAKRLHPLRADPEKGDIRALTGKSAGPPARVPVRALPVQNRESPARTGKPPGDTLDGGWDRRIAKGALDPDFTIDLHGETLASAHVRLNRSLAAAIRAHARVVLLITGKAARDNPRLPPTARGVIRASITDWLSASPYSGHIAAIRNAHPRHGGGGALYVILRRAR